MRTILGLFFALLFFLAARFPIPAAEQGSCAAQLLNGAEPVIEKEKSRADTQELCFSELALRYSGVSRTPLWSAEHLTAERISLAKQLHRPRRNAFHAEPRLPYDARAELADYRGSGFDRGHMSPNGDMSTAEAQAESFSLANMVPQHPCNNEVLWEGIESAVRELTLSEGEVYVVTGPAFIGDTVESLKGRVLVPTHLYKAIYVPATNQAGAYFAPNDGSQKWEALSIAELAARIGIDVFPKLGSDVKDKPMDLPEPTPHFGCRIRMTEVVSPSAAQER